MTEQEIAALGEMWASAEKVWGGLRDIEKRISSSDKAWKEAAASSDDWKAGYQKVIGMKKAVADAVKASSKIVDLTATAAKKLAKEKVENVVKDLKKYDKTVSEADGAIAQYVVWKRKFEKVLTMKIGASDMDMLAMMKNIEKYLHERSLFNKELQTFQRAARI